MASDPLAHGVRPGIWTTRWHTLREATWRLVVSTVGTCFRNRVTGLAAEAAFFALLSLPPLVFGLAGSIGFILALWSGSRALNVFVDTITIMYGLGGHRGIVRTRVLSFSLYVMGLITGVVTIPLVVAGPRLVDKVLPQRADFLNELYWPTVIVLCICFLATLYHVSVPVRTSWRYNIPGAALTMLIWILGSFLLRWLLTVTAVESTSIYGPLAAPIVVMLWLYLLSIAVLIGAALNAAFDRVWPEKETAKARMEVARRLRLTAMLPRLRRLEEEQERFPDEAEDTEDTVLLQQVDERATEAESPTRGSAP